MFWKSKWLFGFSWNACHNSLTQRLVGQKGRENKRNYAFSVIWLEGKRRENDKMEGRVFLGSQQFFTFCFRPKFGKNGEKHEIQNVHYYFYFLMVYQIIFLSINLHPLSTSLGHKSKKLTFSFHFFSFLQIKQKGREVNHSLFLPSTSKHTYPPFLLFSFFSLLPFLVYSLPLHSTSHSVKIVRYFEELIYFSWNSCRHFYWVKISGRYSPYFIELIPLIFYQDVNAISSKAQLFLQNPFFIKKSG